MDNGNCLRTTSAWRPIWPRSNNCAYHARNSSRTAAISSTNMQQQRPRLWHRRPRLITSTRTTTPIISGDTLCDPLHRHAIITCPLLVQPSPGRQRTTAPRTTKCEAAQEQLWQTERITGRRTEGDEDADSQTPSRGVYRSAVCLSWIGLHCIALASYRIDYTYWLYTPTHTDTHKHTHTHGI